MLDTQTPRNRRKRLAWSVLGGLVAVVLPFGLGAAAASVAQADDARTATPNAVVTVAPTAAPSGSAAGQGAAAPSAPISMPPEAAPSWASPTPQPVSSSDGAGSWWPWPVPQECGPQPDTGGFAIYFCVPIAPVAAPTSPPSTAPSFLDPVWAQPAAVTPLAATFSSAMDTLRSILNRLLQSLALSFTAFHVMP